MSPQKPNNTKLKVTSAVVVIVAVVMLTIASTITKAQQSTQSAIISTPTTSSPTSTTSTSTAAPATTSSQSSSTTSASTSSGYKDGTYTATSDYYVPHGYEEIQVSLTLKNGIITDSSIQNSEGNGESAQYQEAFASRYKSYVTGKSISGLNLSYVAGASDTTQGFNDAVSQIQNQAKA
jgi:uncharacterized protein with FMN-binding domain